MRMRPGVGVVAATVLLCASLTSCSQNEVFSGYCLTELAVSPSNPHPGDTITVSSVRACDTQPPDGEWVIAVFPEGQHDLAVTTTVTPEPDDSFRATLTLPSTMPPGPAVAAIDNWDYTPCEDTNASCAPASVTFRVTAP